MEKYGRNKEQKTIFERENKEGMGQPRDDKERSQYPSNRPNLKKDEGLCQK